MSVVTLAILAIFFGLFTFNGIKLYYFGSTGLSNTHACLWFFSAIMFACSVGALVGQF